MKFSEVKSQIATQNMYLKIFLSLSIFAALFFIAITAKLAMKPALLIERACVTRSIEPLDSTKHSEEEIKTFIKEAISERFDTAKNKQAFVSEHEWSFKVNEQRELSNRQMRQSVFVNGVTITKDEIKIDSDRLISVGNVRSAFVFPLTAKIETIARSQDNPYGLLLSEVHTTQKESSSNEK